VSNTHSQMVGVAVDISKPGQRAN